ncbi:hypothetical protein [Grimontia sp. NTOU-MAR1]|uniref:hypothetical protein n=1 Tax=Grimontia sp. NTOU-MAR1 TaxID=3111011 RepID=UPI002DB76887|nr:hypothetical protein [Grimontia sp. NTOU-MAR1]WRV96260.1 hypothetical protein VP504_08925 [Grimontia sp. NTOU-MAR1]
MLKRRFYRLDEISDVTPLTNGDLLDAVETGKLRLCAWVDAKALGATKSRTEVYPYSQIPLFDYRGVLGLSPDDSIKCIQAEEAKVDIVFILEPEKVTRWRHVSVDFPDAKQCRKNEAPPLVAQYQSTFFAFASIGTRAEFGDEMKRLANSGVEEQRKAGAKRLLDAFLKVDKVLEKKSLVIKPEQLRFDLNLVNRTFGLAANGHKEVAEQIVDTTGVETHPIKTMIAKVLVGNREANARTIWNAIRRDHQNDAKQIDTDSLISTMNNDEIEWFGQKDTVRITKYKTFQNLIAEVRKGQT